jgi:small-conductance mechanosensitive channel
MLARLALAALFAIVTAQAVAADAAPPANSVKSDTRAVMTGDQVVQILDKTVDWYRTLGVQQQAATQPSDLLILYANRQIAEKVMSLAFEIARANAELLSSEAGEAQARAEAASTQSVTQVRSKLDEQRASIQAEIEAGKRELAAASPQHRAEVQTKLSVLQGELDLINARRNLLSNMSQFASQSDANGFGSNALKAHIDAIAASIPSSLVAPAAPAASEERESASLLGGSLSQFGVWDLASTVFRLSAKQRTIETIDQRTRELQEVLKTIRTPPAERLRTLAARGDALAAEADAGGGKNLRGVRDQYDTLAWLFQQTSAIVIPLSKAEVLLDQYRRNLANWREATQKQYGEAVRALGVRLLFFGALIAIVFAIAELWKRAVFRYVHDVRRRSRLLLLRRIVFWALIVAIAASTFATELGSLATFAGLITAGLAVAMQSVLVSVVGYFFLIGKYGIRVGDRVQIGNVTGEVIDLGLVRVHLMELSGQGPMSPTGRVVAFANSIIFQASGGLFKQIPGVDLAWHEITLSLPTGADYAALKDQLAAAVTNVIKDYHADVVRQTQAIQRTAASHHARVDADAESQPQVQLRFAASGVEAIVRYPVHLPRAAEIDEHVSRELLNVISTYDAGAAHKG